ncbi:hypothetical protein EMIHUDRAFT_364345 [Emiliania huxleyi CCMP1516]|uniref:Uncharacterized protein n=2 Tax=Emiliania huxleyi TaxID=2903 RepID=A0A0D3KAF3_EMIH1|nr:hypothetical protein EMIHUDRAFT_364345 [Emiliania huxleyi CCMP1516]EOD32738.1 hypothetical protein EMIHUDRAFT_364345 [Emiliania huxleyi CCMP1516]|eukprot:XP_005785167.1 hypothetical protein EMIHUDRAFT_364345 [Emiliania huxleyi CCMP1516]
MASLTPQPMSPRPTYEEVLRLRAASAKQSAEKMAAAPAAAAPANAPQPPPQPPHPPPPAAASAPAPSPPAVAPAPVAAPAKPVAEPAFTDAEVEVLRTPLAPSEWCGSELHERALAYMRSRRDAAVLADPSLAPTVEMASDLRLWRLEAERGIVVLQPALERARIHCIRPFHCALLPAYSRGAPHTLHMPALPPPRFGAAAT